MKKGILVYSSLILILLFVVVSINGMVSQAKAYEEQEQDLRIPIEVQQRVEEQQEAITAYTALLNSF